MRAIGVYHVREQENVGVLFVHTVRGLIVAAKVVTVKQVRRLLVPKIVNVTLSCCIIDREMPKFSLIWSLAFSL